LITTFDLSSADIPPSMIHNLKQHVNLLFNFSPLIQIIITQRITLIKNKLHYIHINRNTGYT